MTDEHLTSYRVDQLELRLKGVENAMQEILLELRASKKAGKWLVGAALAVGSFATWLVHTIGINIGGKP